MKPRNVALVQRLFGIVVNNRKIAYTANAGIGISIVHGTAIDSLER